MKWFNVWVIGFLMIFWYGAYSAATCNDRGMIWCIIGFACLGVAYVMYDSSKM